jgi:hypothetical protein
VAEHLLPPGDDLPLILCGGANTDATGNAHSSRSKHLGSYLLLTAWACAGSPRSQ